MGKPATIHILYETWNVPCGSPPRSITNTANKSNVKGGIEYETWYLLCDEIKKKWHGLIYCDITDVEILFSTKMEEENDFFFFTFKSQYVRNQRSKFDFALQQLS